MSFYYLFCDVQSLSFYLNLLFVTVVEIHTLILDVCVCLKERLFVVVFATEQLID